MRAAIAAFVAVLVVVAPSVVCAQDLAAARAAYLDADFERARDLYRGVLESEGLDRQEAIEALRYLVALDALLGDTEAARGHARSVVALEPSVTVPEGAPEEATALVDAARAEQTGSAVLDIAPAEPMAPGAATTVVLSYAGGPRSLIDELRLRCEGEAGAHEATGSMPEVRLGTPETTGDLACSGEARTRAGAVLAHVSEVLARAASEQPAGEAPPGGGPDLGLILGVTGAVVVAVVTAVVVGVVASTPSGTSFGATQVCGEGWSSC